MSVMRRVSSAFDLFFRSIVTLFFVLMFLLYFGQVVARYAFKTGLPWAEELVRYLMIWMTYIGATVLTREGTQISMTLLEDVFPRMRQWLRLAQYVCTIVFYVIVARVALLTMEFASVQKSPAMGMPMNIVYSVIPLSTIFMVLHLVVRIHDNLKGVEQ